MKKIIIGLTLAVLGGLGTFAGVAVSGTGGGGDACKTPVTDVSLFVKNGVATATFTVPIAGGCATVGLAAYKAANGTPFPGNLPQTLADAETGSYGAGSHELTVQVPDCFAQIDLFVGDIIVNLTDTQRYGDRLLKTAQGESTKPCAEAPVTPPTTTVTTTVTTPSTTVTTPGSTATVTTPSQTVTTPGPTTTVTNTATVTSPAVTVTSPAVTLPAKTVTVVRTKTVPGKTKVIVKPCPKPKAAPKPCPKPKAAPKPCGPGGHKVRDKHGKWHCAYEGKG